MSYLPPEMVIEILEYLPSIEDRKAVSSVCKTWYEAYQSPLFRRDEVVVISAEECFTELAQLKNPDRVFANVLARGVDIKKKSKEFWDRYGENIKSLSIHNCRFREKAFVNIIIRCGELESLCIQDCNELLMSGSLLENEKERVAIHRKLLNLKSLNLGYNRYLSDAIFVRFASLCLRLEELLLPGCRHISFHPGIYRKFYKTDHSNPSESILTFPVIYDFIRENAEYLKILSFSETHIEGRNLRCISETEGLALEKLYIRGCTEITNDSLIHLADYQLGLTHLDISLCPNLMDTTLQAICSRLNNLRFLSIQGCRAITDEGISDLWRLTRLEHLDISECEFIGDYGIIKGICRRENKVLKELNLSHLSEITEKSVIALTKTLPCLRVLDLWYCQAAVTDRAIQSIVSNLVDLRSLTLSMCENLTDTGLTGVEWETPPDTPTEEPEAPCGSAEEQKLRDEKLKEEIRAFCKTMKLVLGSGRASLDHLKNLQHLCMPGCCNITDISIMLAFRFDDLRSLNLSNCKEITSQGLEILLESNTSIENLNLDHCNSIDDDGVGYIFENLKRLKFLTLGSKLITDRVLEFFPKYDTAYLCLLDITHCPQLSLLAVNRIMAHKPQVHVLHLAGKTFEYHCKNFQIPPPPPQILPLLGL